MSVAQSQNRSAFAERVLSPNSGTWWDVVVVTAGSAVQADRYRQEIEWRRREGRLPAAGSYVVAPDPGDRRAGSGGATINALATLDSQWKQGRVFLIHAGGESRRAPQYSTTGKLFGPIPVKTPWGDTSTVFDEMIALSSAWLEKMPPGLVIASGDVVLNFDPAGLTWDHPGVTGVAIRQPAELASHHGVYVTDEQGRVYTYLQKPALAEVRAAGGMGNDGRVALDTGLLRFDADTVSRMMELAEFRTLPEFDLYGHITKALTGQWTPAAGTGVFWRQLADTFHGVPFYCAVVDGEFAHVGTTRAFRSAAAGGVIDSVLLGSTELGPDSVVLECELSGKLRVGQGAILHGLSGISGDVEVPENTVAHMVPVLTEDGLRGTVVRVYGVEDDPKITAGSGTVTWMGRPVEQVLAELGIDPELVWSGIPVNDRSLWNAALFPLAPAEEAWALARWMMGFPDGNCGERWMRAKRLSLQSSAQLADGAALAEARGRRLQAGWQRSALALAKSGTDLRPMLAQAPGIATLAATGRALVRYARELEQTNLTEAASQYVQASRMLMKAGLQNEAESTESDALRCVTEAVDRGVPKSASTGGVEWKRDRVEVSGPPRIDLGGGWSDTPPFCLDWGGTVLNIALELKGEYPIQTAVTRLNEPVIRCVSEETGETAEWRTADELMEAPRPGSALTIPRTALQMSGLLGPEESLEHALSRCGGGLEIRTSVRLPLGSGLGTSSILAATVMQALTEMCGREMTPIDLSDEVMRLEQLMTTGGGWQDQAGGIFPGAKLLSTGPGLRQKIRIQPVAWSEQHQAEFSERLVLCYTGIRRMAKNLLKQVVTSYLAREVATVQVLHSIKTLAMEMAYAMAEGEWEYLGQLLDRHWELNKVLDPNTTNAPINRLLTEVRPYIHGVKLAGAGGGGFMILLARNTRTAAELRRKLGPNVFDCRISEQGLKSVVA